MLGTILVEPILVVVVAGRKFNHLTLLEHVLSVDVEHLADGRQVIGVLYDEVLH